MKDFEVQEVREVREVKDDSLAARNFASDIAAACGQVADNFGDVAANKGNVYNFSNFCNFSNSSKL